MLWTQDRMKLAKLLAEGYEIDATYASPDYLKGGHQIVFIIADPQQMRYMAVGNIVNDDKLKNCLDNTAAYYERVVKDYMGKDYTPDTNMTEILTKTWDFGVVGATYLPDAISAVWEQTNHERTN